MQENMCLHLERAANFPPSFPNIPRGRLVSVKPTTTEVGLAPSCSTVHVRASKMRQKPTQPTQPGARSQPTQPTQPGANPAHPARSQPSQPSQPSPPSQPSQEPAQPTQPAAAADNSGPETQRSFRLLVAAVPECDRPAPPPQHYNYTPVPRTGIARSRCVYIYS